MNPAVESLGFPADARLLVTHLDDVGMNLGANRAWETVYLTGNVSSASVMMPCPWAPEALTRARRLADEGPGNPDLGVHLTLTCEWDSYRWGPLGTGPTDLLTDSGGYLPRTVEEHLEKADSFMGRKQIRPELRHQLENALAGYPDITHMDSHMFAMLHPANIGIYMEMALEYRLPIMVPGTVQAWKPWTPDENAARAMAESVAVVRDQGLPYFDRAAGAPLTNPPTDRTAAVRQLIRDCVPGLNFLFLHANEPTLEAKSISGDWEARAGDLEVFSDPGLRKFIEKEGIHLVGMRELRNLMRS